MTKGSLIFNFDTRKGSLKEQVSNTIPTNTSTVINVAEKGRSARFNGTTSNLALGAYTELSFGDKWTVEIYTKFFDTTVEGSHLISDTAASSRIYYSTGADNLALNAVGDSSATTSGSIPLKAHTNYHLMISNDGSGNVNFIVNNADDAGTDIVLTSKTLKFNNIGGVRGATTSVKNMDGDMSVVRIHTGDLTSSLRAKLYQEFLNSSNIESPVKEFLNKVEHNVNESGLIFLQNYENSNALDLSSSSNNGTIINGDFGVSGLKLNGGNSTVELDSEIQTSLSNVILVNFSSGTGPFNLFASSTTKNYIRVRSDLAAINIEGNSSGVTSMNYTFQTGVDYLIESVLVGTTWYLRINGVDIANQDVGGTANVYFSEVGGLGIYGTNGFIKFAKSYNYARTLVQHKADWNAYARQVVLNEDMSNQNADEKIHTAGMILPNGWRVESGSFKVVETTESKKVFEVVTGGEFGIEYATKVGTYIINNVKRTSGGSTLLPLRLTNSDEVTRYYINLSSDEAVRLYKLSGSAVQLFRSVPSYITITDTYNLKLTIDSNCEFTMYIQSDTDVNFPVWTLIPADAGSNPITDTTYDDMTKLLINADDNNQIGGITIKRGVEK